MTKLWTKDIWQRLTVSIKKAKTSYIAVAYVGKDAGKLLPLKSGSEIVIDLSANAVRAGQTDPREILKLIHRGVSVSSVSNLHAKVFVTGARAFIGSTNASFHSARTLVEAVLETTDKNIVSSCRRFIRSLRGEIVTPEYAKKMIRIYRPPRFVAGTKGDKSSLPGHGPVWLVPLVITDFTKEEKRYENLAIKEAAQIISDPSKFEIETFKWDGTGIADRLKFGQTLVEVTSRNGRLLVSPPCRFLTARSYKKGRASHYMICIERRKGGRDKTLKSLMRRLGSAAKFLKKRRNLRLIGNRELIHSIFAIWPDSE